MLRLALLVEYHTPHTVHFAMATSRAGSSPLKGRNTGRSPTATRKRGALSAKSHLASTDIASQLQLLIDDGHAVIFGQHCMDLRSFFRAVYEQSTDPRKRRSHLDDAVITTAALREALLDVGIGESGEQLPTLAEVGRRNRVSFSDLSLWMADQLELLSLGVGRGSRSSGVSGYRLVAANEEPSTMRSSRRSPRRADYDHLTEDSLDEYQLELRQAVSGPNSGSSPRRHRGSPSRRERTSESGWGSSGRNRGSGSAGNAPTRARIAAMHRTVSIRKLASSFAAWHEWTRTASTRAALEGQWHVVGRDGDGEEQEETLLLFVDRDRTTVHGEILPLVCHPPSSQRGYRERELAGVTPRLCQT